MRKVESHEELGAICQKPGYKQTGNWAERIFARDIALRLTRVLLHTPVTANQLTWAGFGVAIVGAGFLAAGGTKAVFCGAMLLMLWYLLDKADGQIARYRGTSSVEGVFLDYTLHHAVLGAVPFALGWGVYRTSGDTASVAWGCGAGFFLLFHAVLIDTRYKALAELGPNQASSQKNTESQEAAGAVVPLPRRVFALWHLSCEIHNILSAVAAGSVLSLLFLRSGYFHDKWRSALLAYLAFSAFVLWMVKLNYWVKTRHLSRQAGV